MTGSRAANPPPRTDKKGVDNVARGISFESEKNEHGNWLLRIKKSRGKFTLDEIADLLRYENHGNYQGNYAMFINAGEATCGGSGWDDGTEPKGDVVELYELHSEEICPLCFEMLPDPDYCPECGTKLK